jgi:hypothetical protein
MSVFKLPQGCELELKVYLVGTYPGGEEITLCTTVSGMTVFGDQVMEQIDVPGLIKKLGLGPNLEELTWRVMTPEEIKAFKADGEE